MVRRGEVLRRGRVRRLAEDERGAVLILVVFALLGLIAIAALAIDLGVMYTARNESQNVADGAALAGAGILLLSAGDMDGARAEAKRFAAMNYVRGQPVTLQDEDIEIEVDKDKVRVWVRHTVDRGNPVGTFFAKVVGIETVDVVTMAAARAWPAGGAECLVPIVLPDRWTEHRWNDPEGEFECKRNSGDCKDRYDSPNFEPNSDDQYVPWKDSETGNINEDFTGYAESDKGLQVRIRQPQGNGGEINPSWYLHWVFDDNRGGAAFRDAWTNCDPDLVVALGDRVVTEPGNTVGPLQQGVDALLAADDTFWDADQECPVLQLGGACQWGSKRIRPLPMFNPESEADMGSGRKEFTISNFANIYIAERVGQTEIIGYFLGYGGAPSPTDLGEDAEPLFKFVRLIE